MTTLYKFKSYFTEGGLGAAPDPAPVATVVDTDANTKLADGQATTALSNLAGYYEYEYSGADDLDLVCLFSTTDTGTDQQNLVSYVVDKVYKIDAILEDTGTTLDTKLNTIDNFLDTEIAAIKAKTDNLPADPASQSAVESAIDGIPEGITTDDILNSIIEGAVTLRDSLKLANAMNAGKVSGGKTTSIVFRDLADTLDRIIMTVDESGNRSAVVKDLG